MGGEEEMTTAIREVREETGFLLQDLWLYEDLKSEVFYKNPLGTEFTGTYWLTMLVDYNKAVVLSSEHQDFRWVKVKQARKLSSYSNISKLIKNYEAVHTAFILHTYITKYVRQYSF